jgi:hypothetical protein
MMNWLGELTSDTKGNDELGWIVERLSTITPKQLIVNIPDSPPDDIDRQSAICDAVNVIRPNQVRGVVRSLSAANVVAQPILETQPRERASKGPGTSTHFTPPTSTPSIL